MKRAVLVLFLVLALGAALLLRPLAPGGLESHARPAATFDEALRLVDSLRALDSPAIAPECRTELLSHGTRTARVVVLFHGLTNCPAQWDSIARIAYARGANVLVPRLPHHGFADHMTEELAKMDARELSTFTDRVLDAAHGLGDSMTVAGLSIGGVLAAWAGQERRDVDRAVVIVPMFGWSAAPGPFCAAALTRLAGTLPNAFVWWDDKRKADLPGPRHVYPRFATRSVAASMMLGGAVRRAAERRPPAARSLVVLTVGDDPAVDNSAAAALANSWRARAPEAVETFQFPAEFHVVHDVVDPEQVGGKPALTYPVLLEFIAPPLADL